MLIGNLVVDIGIQQSSSTHQNLGVHPRSDLIALKKAWLDRIVLHGKETMPCDSTLSQEGPDLRSSE